MHSRSTFDSLTWLTAFYVILVSNFRVPVLCEDFLLDFLLEMRPNSNTASDTLSEISEASTTGTDRASCYSSDYRDELQEFATSLGLDSVDQVPQERFRIDRKRLEIMLTGKNDE